MSMNSHKVGNISLKKIVVIGFVFALIAGALYYNINYLLQVMMAVEAYAENSTLILLLILLIIIFLVDIHVLCGARFLNWYRRDMTPSDKEYKDKIHKVLSKFGGYFFKFPIVGCLIMEIFEKWKFIYEYRKRLNENNPHTLRNHKLLLLKIERNIPLKFLIILILISILIFISNNYIYNIFINSNIYEKYINFPLSDEDSARYFFSAIPQSLAALLAITFTVLLIYLQISTDKYSIQTVKHIFHGWGANIVISIFLITIMFSFFELGKIRNIEETIYPWDSNILTIFILSGLCFFALISFFYSTISRLSPENFIKLSSEKIRKYYLITLDFTQLIQIKNTYFNKNLSNLKNVEESFFFGGFELFIPIRTSKYGFVQDINISKITECSNLLYSVSDESKLQLNKPIGGRVSSASDELGSILCSDIKTIKKVERIVKKAYKIDNKKNWILEDYNELEPISSLTIKAIKDSEKGVAYKALNAYEEIIIKYIDACKSFALMPSFEQANDIHFGINFLDESFDHLEKIMKVAIKE